jgi:hypothetical protein
MAVDLWNDGHRDFFETFVTDLAVLDASMFDVPDWENIRQFFAIFKRVHGTARHFAASFLKPEDIALVIELYQNWAIPPKRFTSRNSHTFTTLRPSRILKARSSPPTKSRAHATPPKPPQPRPSPRSTPSSFPYSNALREEPPRRKLDHFLRLPAEHFQAVRQTPVAFARSTCSFIG